MVLEGGPLVGQDYVCHTNPFYSFVVICFTLATNQCEFVWPSARTCSTADFPLIVRCDSTYTPAIGHSDLISSLCDLQGTKCSWLNSPVQANMVSYNNIEDLDRVYEDLAGLVDHSCSRQLPFSEFNPDVTTYVDGNTVLKAGMLTTIYLSSNLEMLKNKLAKCTLSHVYGRPELLIDVNADGSPHVQIRVVDLYHHGFDLVGILAKHNLSLKGSTSRRRTMNEDDNIGLQSEDGLGGRSYIINFEEGDGSPRKLNISSVLADRGFMILQRQDYQRLLAESSTNIDSNTQALLTILGTSVMSVLGYILATRFQCGWRGRRGCFCSCQKGEISNFSDDDAKGSPTEDPPLRSNSKKSTSSKRLKAQVKAQAKAQAAPHPDDDDSVTPDEDDDPAKCEVHSESSL